jgi:hypothetical protein
VLCIVPVDHAGRTPEQIADMLAEHLHRQDLSAVEERLQETMTRPTAKPRRGPRAA